MKKFAVIFFALILAVTMSVPTFAGANCGDKTSASASCSGTKAEKTSAKVMTPGEGQKLVVLNVSNMTCGSCVNHVTKTLASVKGVKDVTVSLENGTAEVVYDVKDVEPATLTAAVVKAGYPTTLAQAKEDMKEKTDAMKDCPPGCAKTCTKGKK